MKIVTHRRNTLEALRETPAHLGVEVDIRSDGRDLIVHHDAFQPGPRFDDWIEAYRHGLLILNVKEEGLEERLLAVMDQRGIADFFFLDQSFPFLIRTSSRGERRCAVRVSEFESIETAMSLAGKIDWVWVDCFSRFPLSDRDAVDLKGAGFRLCLVSPELQGRTADADIEQMRREVEALSVAFDAVCTKRPELWA